MCVTHLISLVSVNNTDDRLTPGSHVRCTDVHCTAYPHPLCSTLVRSLHTHTHTYTQYTHTHTHTRINNARIPMTHLDDVISL